MSKQYHTNEDGLMDNVEELRDLVHNNVLLLLEVLESPVMSTLGVLTVQDVMQPLEVGMISAYIQKVHAVVCPGKGKQTKPKSLKEEHVELDPSLERQLRALLGESDPDLPAD